MDKRFLILGALLFLSLACTRKIGPCSSLPEKQACQKLYEVIVDGSEKSMKYLQKKNFEKIKFINGAFSIDPDNDLNIDGDVLKKKLAELFPGKNDCGIVLYDWEGDALQRLIAAKKGSKELEIVEGAFVKALKIGKAFRPNVKFGYYVLSPFRKYWNRDQEWIDNNKKISKLLREVDILFPSIYDFYCDKDLKNPEWDYEYVEANVQLALEIAVQYNKEVIPFIWHRYHSSNKNRSLDPIEPAEFKKHVEKALSVSYRGKRAAGVAWWSADRYFNKTKVKPILRQQKGYRDFDHYYDELVQIYGDIFAEVIENSCTK